MSQKRHYLIDLPATQYSSEPKLATVTTASPKRLREHVGRFAQYFLREMHRGALQFEASETPASPHFTEYKAYLFTDQDRYVGAACFRFRNDQDTSIPWLFDWLWIHPYFRHKGLLSRAWPKFVREIGQFRLAQPMSLHMQQFLRKIGWRETPNPCGPGDAPGSGFLLR